MIHQQQQQDSNMIVSNNEQDINNILSVDGINGDESNDIRNLNTVEIQNSNMEIIKKDHNTENEGKLDKQRSKGINYILQNIFFHGI